MPKISIIVPVYNVEKYLGKCIESILNQTFRDFELILVDDGSTDSSGKICDEYSLKDSRIKVIHKENGGLSSARNTGLDIAKGEYIGFVDSDDWIEMDMYEILYKLIKTSGKDMANIGFSAIYEDRIEKWTDNKKIILNREESLIELLKHRYFGNYIWANLYSKKIFKNIRFTEKIKFEDIDIMYKLLNNSNGIVSQGISKYNYIQRKDSTIDEFFSKKYMEDFNIQKIYFSREIWFKENYPQIYKKYNEYLYNKKIFFLSYDLLVHQIIKKSTNKEIDKIINILNIHFKENLKLKIGKLIKIRLILLKISKSLFKWSYNRRNIND